MSDRNSQFEMQNQAARKNRYLYISYEAADRPLLSQVFALPLFRQSLRRLCEPSRVSRPLDDFHSGKILWRIWRRPAQGKQELRGD